MIQIYFLLLTLSFIYPPLTNAGVIKYIDENGVISFTDDLSKVPEALRPKAQKVDPTFSPTIIGPAPSQGSSFQQWINHPLFKYVVAFVALVIFMLFLQGRMEGPLLRLVVKLLFIGFLGAAIYSVLLSKKEGPSFPSSEKTVAPLLSTTPIDKVKDEIKAIEEKKRREEALIQSLMDPKE